MEDEQRDRLKWLVEDYKGIMPPHSISAGAHELSRRLTNPHRITREELNDFLRGEGLPLIDKAVWDVYDLIGY